MPRRLQEFSFDRSTYDRPNQTWTCGRAPEGDKCLVGPSARGVCQATSECRPVKHDDRWVCTRPPGAGGPCAGGPLPDGACARPIPPCTPVRSLRAWRGIAVLLVVGLALGSVLLALGWRRGRTIVSPGDLTTLHQRAVPDGDCAHCHPRGAGAPIEWLVARVSDPGHLSSSELCLSCHDLGPEPRRAHGQTSSELHRLGAALVQTGAPAARPIALRVASRLLPGSGEVAGERACSSCHREHRGSDGDLTELSDMQCQVCHARQFASLDDGHPEFVRYGYDRRTRIEFDHASHLTSHFTDPAYRARAPEGCPVCHAAAASGQMLTESYERACMACHDQTIRGVGRVGADGLPFLSVPGLDVSTLEANGYSVGEWPDGSAFVDAPIAPAMAVLLAGDPLVAAALASLRGVDPVDLSRAGPEQVWAAFTVGWAIKALYLDLRQRGDKVLEDRAAAALPDPSQRALLDSALRIRGGLADLTRTTSWFHRLEDEVPRYRAHPEQFVRAPAPTATPAARATPSPGSAAGSGSLLAGGGSLLGPAGAAGGASLLGGAAAPAGAAQPTVAPGAPSPAPAGGSLVAAGGASLLGGGLLSGPPPAAPAPAATATPAPLGRRQSGAWFRVDADYRIYYQPLEHADLFLTRWYDLAAELASRVPEKPLGRLLAEVGSPDDPGACFSCHSIDRRAQDRFMVNWRSRRLDLQDHPFTVFAHPVHLNAARGAQAACASCHQLDEHAAYQQAFARGQLDPEHFASNFRSIERAECASCHTRQQAGSACTQCHQYHVGKFEPTRGALPPAWEAKR